MSREISERLFAEAHDAPPGRRNSPVRAFRAVGGAPLFIERGEGAYLFDVDGKRYIDYVGSWGPLILGHAHPDVVAALEQALRAAGRASARRPSSRSSSPSASATRCRRIELVRFVSSGTEATMSALRLARGFTGRAKIVKFDGCYHGHADLLLVKAGSGVADARRCRTRPASPPGRRARHARRAVQRPRGGPSALFDAHGDEIAAVIVEPVAGNMGLVPPAPGFLAGLRELSRPARRAPRLRRGDDRLPRRVPAARRRSTASRPT